MLEGGGGLGGHQSVVFVVVGAPLGVPHDDEGAAQFGQEGPADVAGVGARVVLREVLRTVGQPQLVAVDRVCTLRRLVNGGITVTSTLS